MPAISRPFTGRKVTKKVSGRGATASDLQGDIGYDYRRRVGAYLQKLRLDKGLTQAELGEVLGIGNTGVSSIEHGRVSLSPDHYKVVADLYNLDAPAFAKFLLEMTNPWLFSLMFGDGSVDAEALPTKLASRSGPR